MQQENKFSNPCWLFLFGVQIYIFLFFITTIKLGVLWFMLAIDRKYSIIQVPLIYNPPVDGLVNHHLAKLIVYLVKLFEKENRGFI